MKIETIINFGWFSVLFLYSLATLLFCLRVIFNKTEWAIQGLRATIVGFIIHTTLFGWHLYQTGTISNSFDTWQIISGGLVAIFLILCIPYRFLSTGIIVLPLSLTFYILSLTHIVAYNNPNHFLNNAWAFVHLVFIFLGVTVFLLSMTTGFLYLVLEKRVRNKKFGGFWDRLPSLEVMDTLHFKSLYIGFVFFTVGMITGGGWSKSIYGSYVTQDIKQIISFSVWLFFALFLNLRMVRGWVGRRGIWLACIGFAGILFLLTWVQK